MLEINKVYLGDCLKLMDKIDDKSIAMVLADLPYGTLKCKWDTIIPFKPLWERFERIIQNDRTIVLCGTQPFTSFLIMSNIKLFKYELIWDKKTGMGFLDCKFRPLKSHENTLVFSKAGCSNGSKPAMLYNPQDLIPTQKKNRIYKSRILNSEPKKRKNLNTKFTNYPKSIHTYFKETGLHAAQKPVLWFEYLIRTYTNEGDVVLDCSCGSGTTPVAAIKSNRNFIGIDNDKDCVKISRKRAREALGERKQLGR